MTLLRQSGCAKTIAQGKVLEITGGGDAGFRRTGAGQKRKTIKGEQRGQNLTVPERVGGCDKTVRALGAKSPRLPPNK